jgi:hypothetical protein
MLQPGKNVAGGRAGQTTQDKFSKYRGVEHGLERKNFHFNARVGGITNKRSCRRDSKL